MAETLRRSESGRHHIALIFTRTDPRRVIANCGEIGFLARVDSEHPVIKQNLCKKCLRGIGPRARAYMEARLRDER